MNAYELADAVEGAGDNSFNDQASRMLRQQAEEIEALKEKLELAGWDEDAWKKFKRDNYEVIELKCASGNILSDKAVKD